MKAVESGDGVGVGAVVEVAFEAEERLLVEVVGEVGGGDADAEEEQAGEDDVGALVGSEVGVEEAAERFVEIAEDDEVEDVDAVAVLAEPAHGVEGADAGDEWGVEREGDHADGGEGEGGEVEGEIDLAASGGIEQGAVLEEIEEEEVGEDTGEEDPGGGAENALVQGSSEEEGEGGSGEEGVGAAEGVGFDNVVVDAMQEERQAE